MLTGIRLASLSLTYLTWTAFKTPANHSKDKASGTNGDRGPAGPTPKDSQNPSKVYQQVTRIHQESPEPIQEAQEMRQELAEKL